MSGYACVLLFEYTKCFKKHGLFTKKNYMKVKKTNKNLQA